MKLPPVSRFGNKPGFTLGELLGVIAIGAVLLAIGAPLAFQSYLNQLTIDTSKQLEDTLDIARTYAVSNLGDSRHGVALFPGTNSYVLFQGDSYATRVVSEDQAFSYAEAVDITATTTEVVFSQLYGTSTIDEVWTIQSGTFSRSLRIHPSGSVERE